MKKSLLLLFTLLSISIIMFVGCSIGKMISQIGDSMSNVEDLDMKIPINMSQSKSWVVYEVWVNENISSGILSKAPNRSTSTRIIVSPLYENIDDPVGLNNHNIFEKWIKWLQDDNNDIYFLAKKYISRGTTYSESYQNYKNAFLNSKEECKDIFNNLLYYGGNIEEISKMKEPLKIYLNRDREYEFNPVILVIPQSKRNLEISGGIAKFHGTSDDVVKNGLTENIPTIKPASSLLKEDKDSSAEMISKNMPDENKKEIVVEEPVPVAKDISNVINKEVVVEKPVPFAQLPIAKWELTGVNFGLNNSKIPPDFYPILFNVADSLLNNPNLNVEISAYTDNIGAKSYNIFLSQKRADAVKNYLISKGVPANRLTSVGYGESKPITDNKKANGRAMNNRIEFYVISELGVAKETVSNQIKAIELYQKNDVKSELEVIKKTKSDQTKVINLNTANNNITTQGTIQLIKIGNQIWTLENLNVSKFRNGDLIPEMETDSEWEKAGKEGRPAWCYYENDPENGNKYGKLYNWYAINDPRGLVPEGWHIPTMAEYETLVISVNSNSNPLKTIGQGSGDGAGTNTSGFSVLLAGGRSSSGNFDLLWSRTAFWSSSERNAISAYSLVLCGSNSDIYFANYIKGNGFSVRCVKD